MGFMPIFLFDMTDLREITEQALNGLSIELVDIERAAMGLLQVTIDTPEGVTIEDCENASRLLSRVYEVENIDKRLEVGSPGVDRPLRTLKDFNRFVGERVQIKLYQAVDNQKVFSGELSAAQEVTAPDQKDFNLTYDVNKKEKNTLTFAFSEVEKAKLDPVLNFKGKNK